MLIWNVYRTSQHEQVCSFSVPFGTLNTTVKQQVFSKGAFERYTYSLLRLTLLPEGNPSPVSIHIEVGLSHLDWFRNG